MKNEKFQTVIIGCGSIAQVHLRTLLDGGDAEIVGLCDIDPARTTAALTHFGLKVPTFTDYRQMLDALLPDAVHICTPHHLHCEMACEALSRGIHIYLEKPIAISLPEIARMEAAAAGSTSRVCVSFQNRTLPSIRLLLHLVEESGGMMGARAMVTWHRGRGYYSQDNWHGRQATEGGGVMINQAIHTLDLLLLAAGSPPVSVQGSTALYNNRDFTDVEDNAQFLVNFENGSNACFYATNNYCVDAQNFLDILCRDGTSVSWFSGHIYKNGERMDTEEAIVTAYGKSCWGGGHTICIHGFYDALRTGGEMPVPLESAAVSLRVLLALYRSQGTLTAL